MNTFVVVVVLALQMFKVWTESFRLGVKWSVVKGIGIKGIKRKLYY